MQLPRRGLFRPALLAAAALVALLVTAAPVSARPAAFTQGAIAPAAVATRQALVDLRERPTSQTSAAYAAARATLAAAVATAGGGDASALVGEWDRAGDQRLLVVFTALAQVGARYRYASSDPRSGFDCSGLTSYAWGSVGVGLAHSSRGQIRAATAVPVASTRPGDLVYYPGHVSLAVGDGIVVHAPRRGVPVQVRATWTKSSIRVGSPVG